MGTVYSGVHPIIGKEVAIKVIEHRSASSPTMRQRFLKEAKVANAIRHKNIVDVFAFGEDSDLGHYLVMPLLPGRSLEEIIRSDGPMDIDAALPVIEQVASAIDAAHAAGVWHRDLKAENVIVVSDSDGAPTAQVLDFGIAKLATEGSVGTTTQGALLGTPLYMSPEQWDGQDVDHRTDIYAFGVLIHHILTGRFPYESDSPMNLLRKHAVEQPQLPSVHGAPPFVDRIVARALEKDPNRRFQSATELYLALHHARWAGSTDTFSFTSDLDVTVATRKRRLIPVAVAASVVVLLTAGVVAVSRDDAAPLERAPRPEARSEDVTQGRGSARVPEAALPMVAEAPEPALPISKPAPAPAPDVHIRIISRPPGARILMDGVALGRTPFDGQLPRRDELTTFELIRAGYQKTTVALPLDSDRVHEVEMIRVKRGPKRRRKTVRAPKEFESAWGDTIKTEF